jgi:hypothetical protein
MLSKPQYPRADEHDELPPPFDHLVGALYPRMAVLYQRQYGVRQVEKQRSSEKANHAA